jgi:peptide/nickel transport system substrate-binding protein
MAKAWVGRVVLGLGLLTTAWQILPTGPALAETVMRTNNTGFRTLNPAVQSGGATGVPGSQIFAGLVRIGDKYEPQPYLAESWTRAADGLSYTFKLNKSAKFHDGQPVTASDVAYSLDVVKTNHPFGTVMFGNVSAVETPDPLTVVVRLAKPTPWLLQSLHPLLMPVLPKHVYDDGKDIKTHPRNMQDVVGSGPFRVVENKVGEHLILERVKDYFITGRPNVDRIVAKITTDPVSSVLAMENGDIEYQPLAELNPREVRRLEANKNLIVTTKGYDAFGHVNYLELNLRKAPYSDKRVRQAISYAIDRKFITEKLFLGLADPAYGPIHSASPFFTKDLPHFDGNIDKAKNLLDEAGLKPDASGVRFTMVLDVPNWSTSHLGIIADYLRPQLKKAGIAVELRKSPDFGTWVSRVTGGEYDATMNGAWNYPDPVIGVHRLYLCSNIRKVIWSNTEGYCNEKVDALLNDAAVTDDPAARKALYGQFQKTAAEDVALVFLTEQKYITVINKRVQNYPIGVWGGLSPWDDLSIKP